MTASHFICYDAARLMHTSMLGSSLFLIFRWDVHIFCNSNLLMKYYDHENLRDPTKFARSALFIQTRKTHLNTSSTFNLPQHDGPSTALLWTTFVVAIQYTHTVWLQLWSDSVQVTHDICEMVFNHIIIATLRDHVVLFTSFSAVRSWQLMPGSWRGSSTACPAMTRWVSPSAGPAEDPLRAVWLMPWANSGMWRYELFKTTMVTWSLGDTPWILTLDSHNLNELICLVLSTRLVPDVGTCWMI